MQYNKNIIMKCTFSRSHHNFKFRSAFKEVVFQLKLLSASINKMIIATVISKND